MSEGQYDLGTAHGTIKLDVDDRGAKVADRTLIAFERTLKKLERQFIATNTSLNRIEKEIKNLGREFNRAERDAKSYDRAAQRVDDTQVSGARSTSRWRVEMDRFRSVLATTVSGLSRAGESARVFGYQMGYTNTHVNRGRKEIDILNVKLSRLVENLIDAANAANDFGPAIANMLTLWNRFGNSNGVNGFIRSFRNLPFATSGLSLLGSQFLGLNKAMKNIPQWQKNIVKLVGAFQGAALAGKLFMGTLGRINIVRKGVEKLARPFQVLGATSRFVLGNLAAGASRTGEQIDRLGRSIRRFGGGAAEAIAGMAVFRQGLTSLQTRLGFLLKMPKPIIAGILGIGAAIGPAIEILGKGLSWISNGLLGLLDGVKQLSGGLLAIPGIFATIGVAGGVLTAIFKGIGTSFGDLFKNMDDAEKFAEAFDKIPDSLKPLAKVSVETFKSLKAIQEGLVTTFTSGLDKDVKNLADQFMGPLWKGSVTVAQSLVDTKNKLMDLLTSNDSINDFGLAFVYTAQTIRNLNQAIVPLGNGLRDIAIVGMEFIRNLSGGADTLTKKFEEWAAVNRDNGNLMKWMQDAVQGAKDLARGLWDLTKALWELLTMFATDTGDNALSRFADAMERFEAAVRKSKAEGFLKEVSDAVKNLGTDKLNEFMDIMRSVWDTIKAALPSIEQISSAFKDVFVPAVKLALQIIESLFDALNDSGLNTYIGWILGFVAAWKTLGAVIGPIRNLVQIVSGLGLALAGFKKIAGGFVDVLYYFGPAGRAASTGLSKVGAAASRLAGPLAGAAAVFLVVQAGAESTRQAVAEFDESLRESAENAQTFKEGLRDAFSADLGLSGKNVFDEITSRTEQVLAEQKNLAGQVPGIWENFSAAMNFEGRDWKASSTPGGKNFFDQGRKFNDLQQATQDAAHAQKAFDSLGLSSQNLAGAITGTDSIFNDLVESLKKVPEGGDQAIAILKGIRDEYAQTQADFKAAGTGAVQLVSGIQAIADSGGDATTKLQGLEQALRGLGLLQTSEIEAGFAYAKSIREIGDAAAQAVDPSQSLNDILGPDGNFNFASVNAQNLYNVLGPLAQNFRSLAANGGNVAQMWTDLQPQLAGVAQAFGLTDDKVQALISRLGVVPDVVSILVNVEGGDKVAAQLAAITTRLQGAAQGQEVVVPIIPGADPQKVKQAIESALGPIVNSVNEDVIKLNPTVDPAALAKLKAVLLQNGIPLPGAPTPSPVQMPVEAKVEPPKPTGDPIMDAILSGKQPPGSSEAVKIPAPVIDQAGVEKVQKQIEDLQKKVSELSAGSEDKKAVISVEAQGFDEARAKFDQLQLTLTNSIAQWNGYQNAVGTVIRNILTGLDSLVSGAQQRFDSLNNGQYERGAAFVNDFAKGIDDNIAAGIDAATRLAQAVRDRMPGSPAKKGPLSGSGWTGIAGRAFTEDFATGIASKTGKATSAAEGVAGGAAGGLTDADPAFVGAELLGSWLGRLQDLFGFGQRIVELISKASDTVFNALKFISDPMGKGTFFGGHTGFQRTVNDADLQKKREDDMQSKLSGAMGKTRRTTDASLNDLPGALGLRDTDNPSKEEIAAAIVGEANKRGYGRNTQIGAIAASMLESRMDPDITNASGHKGLFQMSADKNPGDAASQIMWFFDQLDKQGGPGAVDKDPLNFIADRVEKGGYPGSDYQQFTKEAADYVDSITGAFANSVGTAASNIDASDVKVTGREGLTSVTEGLLEQVMKQFPEVANIGGVRKDAIADHPSGRALDIMVGTDKELGDRINEWLRTNANALGIDSTIWRDQWADFNGNTSTVKGHQDHIHAKTVTEAALAGITDRDINDATGTTHGRGAALGPDFSDFSSDEMKRLADTQGLSYQTEEQMLDQLRINNTSLDNAIRVGQDPNSSDAEVIKSLNTIQSSIMEQGLDQSASGRAQMQALEGVKSGIMDERGMGEASNPLDTAQSIASGATSIAGDVFSAIESAMNSVGAAKNLTDIMVRGVSNSEDIYNAVDQVQQFIDLAARIAGAVSSISGTIGSIVSAAGSADPSGGASGAATALQGVSAISGLISSGLDTINGIIDMAQELYHIVGGFVGDFISSIVGVSSSLEGDVKFLLDYNDNTLKSYSADNPLDKRELAMSGRKGNPDANQPLVGSISVVGGPGTDPRDTTRQLMWALKTGEMGIGGFNEL